MADSLADPAPSPDPPGPQSPEEASAMWLDEAEAMRAAQGANVTLGQALAFSIAYGLQALLETNPETS